MAEMVTTERGRFCVEQTGSHSAKTIVFVAGLGDDHSSWAEPVSLLADSYHCVTFDNRGIGESPITAGPYSVAQLAEDAQALAAELGLERFAVVGSSMGGAICQEWALAYPDQIDQVVLSNSWGERDQWFTSLFDHWIELAGRGSGRDLLYQLALFSFSPEHLTRNPGLVSEFLDAPVPNLDGLRAAGRACQGHHTLERLAMLQLPTLIIGGEQDILTRPAFSRRLAEAIPNSRLHWLPTGHMTFWEQPTAWAEAVDGFVSGAA